MSVKDWKPLLILGLINAALLFSLGFNSFIQFLESLQNASKDMWTGNHSIASYCFLNGYPSAPFYIGLVGLFAYSIWKRRGMLMSCTCMAMLLPSISHDYKLPILAFPVAMIQSQNPAKLGIYFLYSIALFSYVTKPPWLTNNLPVLFGLLILSLFADENANHRKT